MAGDGRTHQQQDDNLSDAGSNHSAHSGRSFKSAGAVSTSALAVVDGVLDLNKRGNQARIFRSERMVLLCRSMSAKADHIKVLILSGSRMEPEALKVFVRWLGSNTQLQRLDLAACALSGREAELVVQTIVTTPRSQVSSLNLAYNSVDPRSAKAIADFLKLDSSPIRHLIMHHNPLALTGIAALVAVNTGGQTGGQSESPYADASAVPSNLPVRLETLRCHFCCKQLGRTALRSKQNWEQEAAALQQGMSLLCGALRKDTGLKQLTLWGNNFTPQQVRLLHQAVSGNTASRLGSEGLMLSERQLEPPPLPAAGAGGSVTAAKWKGKEREDPRTRAAMAPFYDSPIGGESNLEYPPASHSDAVVAPPSTPVFEESPYVTTSGPYAGGPYATEPVAQAGGSGWYANDSGPYAQPGGAYVNSGGYAGNGSGSGAAAYANQGYSGYTVGSGPYAEGNANTTTNYQTTAGGGWQDSAPYTPQWAADDNAPYSGGHGGGYAGHSGHGGQGAGNWDSPYAQAPQPAYGAVNQASPYY